jgi:hypothetical protein
MEEHPPWTAFIFTLKTMIELLMTRESELADREAARREAITAAADMLRDGSGKVIWGGKPWRMWVTQEPNGTGKPLFTLRFSRPRADQYSPET